jgi:pSer/pThr/pTyr-binding forkhead associated (FHA) protein
LLADLPGLRNRIADLARRGRDWLAGPKDAYVPELRLPDTTRRVELSIGRADDCDLVLDEATVSRRHALLRRTPAGWALRDLGSTNGTRVNGWRVDEAELHAGDELMLGHSRFVVRA